MIKARWVIVFGQFVVTGSIFWWVSSKVVVEDLLILLSSTSMVLLLAIFFLLSLQQVLVAIRFGIILKALGTSIGLPLLIQISWISSLLGYLTVLGVGSEAYRAFRCVRLGLTLTKSLLASFFDRALGLSILLLMTGFSFLMSDSVSGFFPGFIRENLGERWLQMFVYSLEKLVFVSLVCMSLGVIFFRKKIKEILTLVSLKEITVGLIVASIGCAILVHIISIFVVYILSANVGVDIGWRNAWFLGCGAILITLLPISLGGWGPREVFFISYFNFLGYEYELGLAVGILFGLCVMLTAATGATILVNMRSVQN